MWRQDSEYVPLQAGSIDGTDVVPHDRAIKRAIKAVYDPSLDQKMTGDPWLTLFVGRLNPTTSEDDLRLSYSGELSKYGRISSIRLVRDIVTGTSRRYAFVTFADEDSFNNAFVNAHHIIIDGRQILVDYQRDRTMPGWVPRRLGGGLGGKKESGQLRFGGRERPFRKPIILPGQSREGLEFLDIDANLRMFLQGEEIGGRMDTNVMAALREAIERIT